jgi:cytochrome P450
MAVVREGAFPTLDGFDPLSDEFLRDPYPIIDRARRECPVFYYPTLDAWFVTRYDDIAAVLQDYRTYSSRSIGSVPPPPELADEMPASLTADAFIALDPPEHTVARKKANSWFTRARVEAMQPGIRARANELIDGFAGEGRCDLMHAYCYALTLRTIVDLLGMNPDDMPRFRDWTEDMFSLLSPIKPDSRDDSKLRPIGEEERRVRWARIAEARRYYAAVADDRRASPGDDLITEMAMARDEEGRPLLPDHQIVTHIRELIAAGNDTTANLMGHTVLFLDETPEQIGELQRDPSLWPNAVEEGLRRRGSSVMNFRLATRDVELGGIAIPAGSVIGVMFACAGHDETHFPNPRAFDIHRANADSHLSFGKGRHVCMGAPLARVLARTGLETLYERIPDLRVVPGQTLDYVPTYTAVTLKRLEVEWDAR